MKLTAQIPTFNNVRFIDKLLFTKHLSIMAKSDITIMEAIDILASQTESHTFQKVLYKLVEDVKNGKSLSGAMEKQPKVFDAFYTNIIAVGESSGTLDKSLIYLSTQLSKEYAFHKVIQGAMLYPIIVLIAVGSVGIGVSIFVLPKLLDLFNGFGEQLPFITTLLISFAGIMQNYWILVLIGVIALVFGLRYLFTWSKSKPYIDKFILDIPFFGRIVKNAEISMLCRNLGTLLKSGMPINSALAIEMRMSRNYVFQYYIINLLAATEKGKSLSGELENRHFKHFPPLVTKMIAVGEKTGFLDDTLLDLGDFYEGEVNDQVRNISTLLEPVMLLVIGGIVAFVALAIITPIYQLTGSIGGQ